MSRLKAIKARVEGAGEVSEPPWRRVGYDVVNADDVSIIDLDEPCEFKEKEVATLIAPAPADLAWLVGWVEEAADHLRALQVIHRSTEGLYGNHLIDAQLSALLARMEGDQ